ncbi:tyrosine-type recombinase/integrase [Rhodopseudomonas pseudopalustris]|uniref:Site-specific recombinase XerD n=1 Tax=Rhodopseudomonas pseudopalustris TaxID=1513892 RepID=A0A1H8NC69_9BRAD|nr:tyrosine-type recombinase/integrase [Rhodopseudomonas pseudopalustris]SEO27190.1 Site-specific recombinase XerD [Rhodopseudomonas pseudopalustris]
MADTKYLQKKGNTWRVVVEIPKPLRPALEGKPRFIKSLGTESLTDANRLKHQHVAEFKRRIKLAEKGQADPRAAAMQAAFAFREAFASADNDYLEHGDQESTAASELLAVVNREAEALLETEGPEAARLFRSLATGKATLIRDQYPTWLTICNGTEQTKAQHKSTIKRYLAWAGEYMSIQGTDRRKAGEYVQLLRDDGLSSKTIQRHLSTLASLWSWLMSKGLTDPSERDNPWRGHGVGKRSSGSKRKAVRKGLTNDKLLKLLKGRYKTPRYANVLSDLTRLALLHGTRLDELCALKKADVEKLKDGYWFSITEGKTEAAIRQIPVHTLAVPIIQRRLAGADEYLFAGLVPGGPDLKRSWNVSKAYGRFRKQVGVSAPFEDFHALRKTFADLMESLEVPESTVQLIIGHERGFTYGVYSTGQRMNLRKVIEKVDYGPDVMKALASP